MSPPVLSNKTPKPKCAQCRKYRQACLPQPRIWPAKCDRCHEKNLPCSEPAWAPRFRPRAIPDAATTSQAGEAPAASSRGHKRPLLDIDSPDSLRSSLSERPVEPGIHAIQDGPSRDSEVQLSDLVDAVRMYQLVATEHRNLKRVKSSVTAYSIGKPERLLLLESTLRGIRSCLIDALEAWRSNHSSSRNSAEMLLLNQLQRAVIYPDIGIQESEYASPIQFGVVESIGPLILSLEEVLQNNPRISEVSFAAEMLFSEYWSSGHQRWSIVKALLWNWWRDDKGFTRMASTAKLLNLPEECQTIYFWKSSTVVVPRKWSGEWDPPFYWISFMSADELIASIKKDTWGPDTYGLFEHACGNDKRDAFGQTLLHTAAAHGSVWEVSNIMSMRSSFLKAQSSAGHTPVHIAASRGSADMCNLMLQRKDGVLGSQLRDKRGWTALWHAAQNGNSHIFRQILALGGQDLREVGRQTDNQGKTLLMIANLKALLAQDITDIIDSSDLSKKDIDGNTALHRLIMTGDLSRVQMFLSSTNPGVALALQDTGEEAELSPLECALETCDDIAVALLGCPGIVVQPTSSDFPNLLFHAISEHRIEAAKVLARRSDIDIFARHDGMTVEEMAHVEGLHDLEHFLGNLKRLSAEEGAGYHEAEEQNS